jgi:hypothetical protein
MKYTLFKALEGTHIALTADRKDTVTKSFPVTWSDSSHPIRVSDADRLVAKKTTQTREGHDKT